MLVLRAQRNDVRQVFIAVELVWDNAAPTRFVLSAAANERAARLQAAIYPRDQERIVRAITPHLRAWHTVWQEPELQAWIDYASRV